MFRRVSRRCTTDPELKAEASRAIQYWPLFLPTVVAAVGDEEESSWVCMVVLLFGGGGRWT